MYSYILTKTEPSYTLIEIVEPSHKKIYESDFNQNDTSVSNH